MEHINVDFEEPNKQSQIKLINVNIWIQTTCDNNICHNQHHKKLGQHIQKYNTSANMPTFGKNGFNKNYYKE